MPVDHKRYFDRRAESYDRKLGRDRWPRNQRKKAELVREALGGRVGTLVDVGCGTGQLLEELLRANACDHAIGLDPAPAMLRLAQSRLAAFADRVELRSDAAEATGLHDGVADAVVGVDLLHHLEDADAAVAEARRVLRPGGTAVFLESNVRFPVTFVIGLASREERGMFRTSRASLERLLRRGGFAEVSVGYAPLFTPPGPDALVGAWDRLDELLARIPGVRACAIFYRARATAPDA